MKTIAILGSTGSIGISALDVVSRLKKDFRVAALTADSSVDLLSAQARALRPDTVCVGNARSASTIKRLLPRKVKILVGADGLNEIVRRADIDMIVLAISGNASLEPLVAALESGKQIALANKEALVSAGPLIMKLASERNVKILPVDSEHSAIFQCIDRADHTRPARIYLTGSGGPLLDIDRRKFNSLSASDILRHPKWRMGKKISVDSATMMNKGLEILEAQYLFGIDQKLIEVLVHPEAIIHSMVEFADGSVMAQMALPDMRLPIQYALTYPCRVPSPVKSVDFVKVASLTFREPDTGKFPCLNLARQAASSGGTAPVVLCACDEEAVRCYLEGRIRFTDIPNIIEKILGRHKNVKHAALAITDVLQADLWAREEARSLCYH